MSKKKKNRKKNQLRGIQIPCPDCEKEGREHKGNLIFSEGEFIEKYYPILWNGTHIFADREKPTSAQNHKWFNIKCEVCKNVHSMKGPEELKAMLEPYIELMKQSYPNIYNLVMQHRKQSGQFVPLHELKNKKNAPDVFRIIRRDDAAPVESAAAD